MQNLASECDGEVGFVWVGFGLDYEVGGVGGHWESDAREAEENLGGEGWGWFG